MLSCVNNRNGVDARFFIRTSLIRTFRLGLAQNLRTSEEHTQAECKIKENIYDLKTKDITISFIQDNDTRNLTCYSVLVLVNVQYIIIF